MSAATELADELFKALLDDRPTAGSLLGVPGYDDRLSDHSAAADDAFAAVLTGIADRVRALDQAGLSEADRLTCAVIIQQAEVHLDWIASRWVEFTVSDFMLTTVPNLLLDLAMVPVTTPDQGESYLRRLAAPPAFFDTLVQRHRAGIAAGLLPVAHLVRAAIAQLDDQLATIDMLRRQPSDADPDYAARCAAVVADIVVPAIRGYRDTLAGEILRHGRDADHAGVCWLPDGDRRYATAVRGYTTTDRSPDELHRTGLDVIARLAAEYVEIGARVFGTDDLQEIFARLRDDPDLRCRDGDELLVVARDTVRRAEAVAADRFRTLPSSSCVVVAYPSSSALGNPPGYMGGALDGSRPGTYFVNTKRPADNMRYLGEVTAFHEAVPGHHFESTTRLERTDLPELRRVASLSAFAEGWGLYCERLADEMGLYSDDLARLGMLVMDSTRAGRLVADTGLHAKGWTRQQAIDYLRANTPMAPEYIESEVDRYLADPGQALAYLVGRLEIQRLRELAERSLGDRFDIRDFHEVVLAEGRIPLSALADRVTGWIGRAARSA